VDMKLFAYLHDLHLKRHDMCSPKQSRLLLEVAFFAGPGSSLNLLQRVPLGIPSEIR